MATIEETLFKLSKSKFRSSFYLTKKDKAYIEEKGMDTILKHAEAFVKERLAPKDIPNDGKQTPYRSHPVFKAQHATACCCRGCLNKWYRVPLNTELSEIQQKKIVGLIMAWIQQQMTKK